MTCCKISLKNHYSDRMFYYLIAFIPHCLNKFIFPLIQEFLFFHCYHFDCFLFILFYLLLIFPKFLFQAQLDAHLKLHNEKWTTEDVRKCKLCHKQFTQPALYRQHIREHYRVRQSSSDLRF